MANVKLSEKTLLEQFQAKLVLLKGKKFSQQELLDKCIRFSNRNFDQFINEELDSFPVTPEKILQIKKHTIKTGYAYKEKSDDELIYNK